MVMRPTSLHAPEQIMQEMLRALRASRVAFKQVSPSLVRCERKGMRFDMQISQTDQTACAYLVKLHKIAGELGDYRETSAKVLAEMQL